MAENRREVVVTEAMLTQAARVGDVESLTIWARQGVRVITAVPLDAAARGRHFEVMRCLVREMGVDVNQTDLRVETPLMLAAMRDEGAVVQCLVELGADVNRAMALGRTSLLFAAREGHLAIVRCLVQFGARIGAVDKCGNTALLLSICYGHYSTAQYLLEEASANMDDVNNRKENLWNLLAVHLQKVARDYTVKFDPLVLTGLLRVLVLRDACPPALWDLLLPEHAHVMREGSRLRARLPAYLYHRRAYLDSRCPRISLLPGVLRSLIYGFEGPATTEELWATGLGTALGCLQL
jgi:hypothetical protein